MFKFLKCAVLSVLLGAALCGAAYAGNTTFFTSIGDLVFPYTAPLKDGTDTSCGNADGLTPVSRR